MPLFVVTGLIGDVLIDISNELMKDESFSLGNPADFFY